MRILLASGPPTVDRIGANTADALKDNEKAKREAAERFGKIKVTVHLIMESGNDDEKSSNGVPTVAAVSEAFGEKVSGSEIKMAHEEIMKSAEPEK